MKTGEAKFHLLRFMQDNYTDERLAMLQAHTEDGRLAYTSCCCFIGVATADHALRGKAGFVQEMALTGSLPEPMAAALVATHYRQASHLPGAARAEEAYWWLGVDDHERRHNLLPIIRAEMNRRELARVMQEEAVNVGCATH